VRIPVTCQWAWACCRVTNRSDPLKPGKTAVVVGAQWGDEGKGKIVDVLSERFKVVARYSGGHNAGHTVTIKGKKFILQLIPCGVLREGCRGVIGNGVVLDPFAFMKEVDALRATGVQVDGNLFISNRAHVILPYHRMIELAAENAPGRVKIGTTSRGIGPAYSDKMARSGLRVQDLLDKPLLKKHIENACREKNTVVHALFNSEPIDPDKMYTDYAKISDRVAPFVTDTALLLNNAIAAGESVMFEGAQGTMLDIDHGTYPFVTSSSATSGGAATGTGVPPNAISMVAAVTKAYCTRVGGGPFPTELNDEVGEALRRKGNEFGAVTGRPRRTGWLDLPLLRYSNMINGTNWLIVTKLDVLDDLATIPICTSYRVHGKETQEIPAENSDFEQIEPVYTELPGWQSQTYGADKYDQLPDEAKRYLEFIEQQTGAKVGIVSTGPDREQTIFLDPFTSALDSVSETA
jgi:adenylosuccinate synthase